MTNRPSFYLAPDLWQEPICLEGPEHHHMTRVLRMQKNDTGRLLDGQGREALFSISSVHKKGAVLKLLETWTTPPPVSTLHLALGWNRSSRRSWFFEKAVELEAAGILFWQAEHSQGKVPSEPKSGWFSQLIAGAKQCRNPWLPQLHCIGGGAGELLELGKDFDHFLFLWEKSTGNMLLEPEAIARPGKTLVVIGPEGGLSDAEAELLECGGCRPASLGRRVLRWETAAFLCLGLGMWKRNLQQNDLQQE